MGILNRPRKFRHNTSGPAPKQHPDAQPTGLPEGPCFYCGERGWCRHRKP